MTLPELHEYTLEWLMQHNADVSFRQGTTADSILIEINTPRGRFAAQAFAPRCRNKLGPVAPPLTVALEEAARELRRLLDEAETPARRDMPPPQERDEFGDVPLRNGEA